MPLSNGLRYRSAVPGDSDPCPRSRCVDQLSLMTRTSVRVLEISTICPWLLTIRSKGPWCGPAVWEIRARVLVPMGSTAFTDDSCPGLRDRGFDPLCWTSRARVRGLKVSTSSPGLLKSGSRARGVTSWPGRLMPGSEVPRVRPALPGDSGPCPNAQGVDSCLGDSGPCPRSHRVDQLYRATRARVRCPVVSTSCP